MLWTLTVVSVFLGYLALGISSAAALGTAADDDPIDADAESPVKSYGGGTALLLDCGWAMAGLSPRARDIILA